MNNLSDGWTAVQGQNTARAGDDCGGTYVAYQAAAWVGLQGGGPLQSWVCNAWIKQLQVVLGE